MSLSLGEALLYLKTNSDGLNQGLKEAESTVRSRLGGIADFASKGFGGLQKVVGAGLLGGLGIVTGGIAALTAEMSNSVELAKIQQDAEQQLEAILTATGHAAGLTAAEIKAMASELQGVTNFGDEATLMGQSMLLTFTNIGKDVFPRATETMLDMSTVFGGDLKSSAIQLGKALNDPIAGVSALGRVGVQFNEEQKAMIKGMVEAGDIASAQGVILSELERQIGGSARAMADPADQLANAWGDFKEVIGGAVLPYIEDLQARALPLVNRGIELATGAISSFFSMVEGGKDPLHAFVDALDHFVPLETIDRIHDLIDSGVILKDQVIAILQPLWDAVAGFVSWQDILMAVGIVVATIVIPILGSIVAAAAPVIAVAAALVAGVALLRNAWQSDFLGMRTALTEFWDQKGKPALSEAQAWLREHLPRAITTLKGFWENQLLPAMRTVWQFIDQNIIPLVSALANVWFAGLRVQIALLQAAFQNVFLPVMRTVWQFIDQNIIPIFRGMDSSIGGIAGTIQRVIGWANSLASTLNSVADRIPNLFRPGSPTPFEMGWRGIANAMDEARLASGQLGNQLSGRLAPAAAASGYVGPTTINMYGGEPQATASELDRRLDTRRRRGLN